MRLGIYSNQYAKLRPGLSARPARTPSCRASRAPQPGCNPRRPRTLYDLLGIKRTASFVEVRAAYRAAARRLHPDTNASPVAQEDFQRIKAAYEVLGDSNLRKQYDNMGIPGLGPQYFVLATYLADGNTDTGLSSNGAAGVGGGGGLRGRDVHTVLGIMLSEAAQGADKTVTYEAHTACEECKGTGSTAPAPPCPVCRGSGEVLRSEYLHAAASGQFGGPRVLALSTCPACAGEGTVKQPACKCCRGRGRRKSLRELAVRVPAGVERGQLLKFGGEGGAGRCGGPPGDLLVRLEVYADENLERQGADLHSGLQVDVFSALLGATVAVNTVRGSRLLDIPPGAQPGDVLRLSGAGVVRAAAGGGGVVRGDHVFTLQVTLPAAHQLCAPSRELLRRLAQLQQAQPEGRR